MKKINELNYVVYDSDNNELEYFETVESAEIYINLLFEGFRGKPC